MVRLRNVDGRGKEFRKKEKKKKREKWRGKERRMNEADG